MSRMLSALFFAASKGRPRGDDLECRLRQRNVDHERRALALPDDELCQSSHTSLANIVSATSGIIMPILAAYGRSSTRFRQVSLETGWQRFCAWVATQPIPSRHAGQGQCGTQGSKADGHLDEMRWLNSIAR